MIAMGVEEGRFSAAEFLSASMMEEWMLTSPTEFWSSLEIRRGGN